jgi:acetyl-CoA carboxylase biotin carboxyl carrier protein
MDQKEIKKMITALKETDVEELKFESENTKVYFKKSEVAFKPEPIVQALPVKVKEPVIEKKFLQVKAPMVGTFYHAESSDRPPFVLVGNNITPGQKVGVIEAMKVTKYVDSNIKGKIVKVLVKNGQPVEYGQELFLVDAD